jgi:hypothetical protein
MFLTKSTEVRNAPLDQLLSTKCIWRADTDESGASTQSFSYSTSQNVQSIGLAAKAISFQIPEIDTLLPERGLARKTIHEIFYRDPLQPHAVACTLSTLLAYNAYRSSLVPTQASLWRAPRSKGAPHPLIVWIGSRCWPSPLVLSSYESQSQPHFLQHCLFINPPNEKTTLWAIETALRSPAAQLVIACCPKISRSATQRLALAARNNNSTAILLRHIDDIKAPSHALSRWEVSPAPSCNNQPSWNLTLHKLKGLTGQNHSWYLSLQDTSLLQNTLKFLDTKSSSDATEVVSAAPFCAIKLETGTSAVHNALSNSDPLAINNLRVASQSL